MQRRDPMELNFEGLEMEKMRDDDSANDSKKLVTVWAKYISASERSYLVLSENGMANVLWS